MRAWLSSSSWGRFVCLTLLVLFALVCGVHLAGVHHDADTDGLGLVDALVLISMVLVAMALAASVTSGASSSTRSRSATTTSIFLSFGPDPQSCLTGAPLRR